jgi:mono/diheme cytochrome c family protein
MAMRRPVSAPCALALFVLGSCSLYVEPEPPATGLPISGGTLLTTRDGRLAVASDPARDQLLVVDVVDNELVRTIALQPGDEPGRLAEDDAGRIHVALRRGGALVTIAGPLSDDLVRRPVCAAPRGVTWQASGNVVHVACATGELVTFPAAGGDATRTIALDRDLRDVVVIGDALLVTRFRSAEALWVAADGTITRRDAPVTPVRDDFGQNLTAVPAVAWRTVSLGGSRALMIHQRASRGMLSTSPGGYGGGMCNGVIEATATIFDPVATTPGQGRVFPLASLPVDVAVSPDGLSIAAVMAGDFTVRTARVESLAARTEDPCGFSSAEEVVPADVDLGRATSVAFTTDGRLVVQYDNGLTVRDSTGWNHVVQHSSAPQDPGRDRFHRATFSGLACASCHPEGREDGLVWTFDTLGERRTQDIGGNLQGRGPYHWDGDMQDLSQLINDVLVGRMGGEPLVAGEERALQAFLFALPPHPAPTTLDQAAVARGRTLFESAELGCVACHSGELYTTNGRADVGTGGRFKVPSLVGVGWRAPYMHTGCAPTLRDRFGTCGGSSHGATGTLDDAQLGDLVTFLESL